MAKQIPEITLTMLLNVDSGASLKQALPESEKFLKKLKTNLDTHMKDMISEEAMADALTNGVKHAVDQLNQQLKTFGLNQLDAKNFLGSAAPFEEIGKVYGQTLADAFKNQFGQSMNGVVEDVLSKLDTMGKYGSRTIEQLRAAGERYLKVTEKGNKTSDSTRIDKAISNAPNIRIKDNTRKVNDNYVDQAVQTLISRYDKATKSNFGNKWEQQYAADINFIKYYQGLAETLQREGKSIESAFKGQPELFGEINAVFNSLVGTLQDKINMLSNVREYNPFNPTQFTHGYDTGEPWAREQTLQEVKNILANGIKVDAKIEENNANSSNTTSEVNKQRIVDEKQRLTREISELEKQKSDKQTELSDLTRTITEKDQTLKRQKALTDPKILDLAKQIINSQDQATIAKRNRLFEGSEQYKSLLNTTKGLKTSFASQVGIKFAELESEYKKLFEWVDPSHFNETYKVYRGVAKPDEDNERSRKDFLKTYGGAEHYSDSRKSVEQYAEGEIGQAIITEAIIEPKNPIIIDANGATYKDFGKMTLNGISLYDVIPELKDSLSKQSTVEPQKILYDLLKNKYDFDSIAFRNVRDDIVPDKNTPQTTTWAVLDDSILTVIRSFNQFAEETNFLTANLPDWYQTDGLKINTPQVTGEHSGLITSNDVDILAEYIEEYRRLDDLDDLSDDQNRLSFKLNEAILSGLNQNSDVYDQIEDELLERNKSAKELAELIVKNKVSSDVTEDTSHVKNDTVQSKKKEISDEMEIKVREDKRLQLESEKIEAEQLAKKLTEDQNRIDEELKTKKEELLHLTEQEAKQNEKQTKSQDNIEEKINREEVSSDGSKVFISLEGLKELLESVVYNTKVVADSDLSPNENNKKHDDNLSKNTKNNFEFSELEGLLQRVTYNVKLTGEQNTIKDTVASLSSNKEFLEYGSLINSQTGKVSKILPGNKTSMPSDFYQKIAGWNKYDTVVHSHPEQASWGTIVPSVSDTKQFLEAYDKFKKQMIITSDEMMQLDFSSITKEELGKRYEKYKELASPILEKFTVKDAFDKEKPEVVKKLKEEYGDLDVAGKISVQELQKAFLSIFGDLAKVYDINKLNTTLPEVGILKSGKQNNISEGIAGNDINEISPEILKTILEGIVYNIKDAQEDTQMPWGREDTLNEIKSVVESVQQLLTSNPDDFKQFNYEGLAEALNGVTLKSSIEAGENFNTNEEITQMSALEREIQKVSEAVRAKTEAFVLEEQQVRQGVGKEISGLNQMEVKLQSIKNLLDSINKINIKTVNVNTSSISSSAKNSKGNNTKSSIKSDDLLDEKIDVQLSKLMLLHDQLEVTGKLTTELDNKWIHLVDELNNVSDAEGLKKWRLELQTVKAEMDDLILFDNYNTKEQVASFKDIESLTKLYNTMSVNASKASGPESEAFYTEQMVGALREINALKQQINLTSEQQARLDDLEIDRKRKISEILAKKTDSENVATENAQLKERNDIIKQLGNAYEKYGEVYQNALNYEGSNLGDYFEQEAINAEQKVNQLIDKLQNITGADFNSDWVTNARKRIDIGSERANSAYGKSSAQKADAEAEAAARKANAEAMKEETKAIVDIKSQYQELAKVEAQLDTATRRGASTEEVAALQKSKQELEDIISVKLKDAGLDAKVFDTAKLEAYNKKLRQINESEARRADRKTFKQAVEDARIDAGTSQTKSVINKSNNTLLNAMTNVGQASQDNTSKIENFYNRVQELQDKLTDFNRAGDLITEQDKKDLREQTENVNILNAEITKMMQQYEQLSGDNVQVLGANTLGNSANIQDYKVALTQMVKTATNGRATITGFDATTKTLTYTMKGAGHETTSFSATLRDLDNSFVTVEGTTKKAETLIDSIKRKTSEILTYFTGSSVIYKAVAEVRKGITYVQEIDAALTELKKVTDETEETYDRFLDTASKTASKVGTTIKDIVNSTADWARLNI